MGALLRTTCFIIPPSDLLTLPNDESSLSPEMDSEAAELKLLFTEVITGSTVICGGSRAGELKPCRGFELPFVWFSMNVFSFKPLKTTFIRFSGGEEPFDGVFKTGVI